MEPDTNGSELPRKSRGMYSLAVVQTFWISALDAMLIRLDSSYYHRRRYLSLGGSASTTPKQNLNLDGEISPEKFVNSFHKANHVHPQLGQPAYELVQENESVFLKNTKIFEIFIKMTHSEKENH